MNPAVSFIQKALRLVPYFGRKLKELDDCGYAPGHYYSPIPNLEEIKKRKAQIFNTSNELKGINLRKEEQFALLQHFSNYYTEIPYDFINAGLTDTRYQVNNDWYKYSDAIMLYSVLRHFKPSRIIEAGSGYSSAIMLDVNERFFNSKASFIFIDPFPKRLLSLLNDEDTKQHQVIQTIVQEADPAIFTKLERNDILFIDSSHISKVGSDLNYILFEILPLLKPGVLIHFHDIFYPFELPEEWILEKKWFWNENYILRAFLSNNNSYEIINFNTWLHKEYGEWLKKNMPACLLTHKGATGSIWIRKNN